MRSAGTTTIVLLGLLLTGCGHSIATESIGFMVEADANDRSPVPVDLVIVYNPEVTPLLLELTARQWFEARDQLLLDHPQGLGAHHWELVPGQDLPMQRLPVERDGAVAAFIFADYLAPGPHRVRIDPYARVRLRLTNDELLLEQVP